MSKKKLSKTEKLAIYTAMGEDAKIQFCTANGLSIDVINAEVISLFFIVLFMLVSFIICKNYK